MIKWIGAILIVGAFSASGISGSLQLARRAKGLSDMLWALQTMKSEILFQLTPLPELCAYLARQAAGETGAFFAGVSETLLREGEDGFYAAWRKNEGRLSSLDRDDLELLAETARVLGRYSAEEQAESLSGTIRRFELRRRDAENDRQVKGRLYRVLGTGLGILAVLLLI